MSYFIVSAQANGCIYYLHVEAADSVAASELALDLIPSADSAQVVREIGRDEFERLTQVR